MPFLAETLGRISPSPTVAITAKARAMAAAGHDIISLSAGEPDFDTPRHIRDAGHAAIEAGKTRYTSPEGIAELRAAIADKFARDNGIHVAPDQVVVSTGGKQCIYNALMATLDPGDEVIIPAPFWVSYPDMVRLAGGTPVILPTDMNSGFKVAADALETAITPRTKWLILNSPSNPSGAVYAAAEMKALTNVLLAHPHVHVLADDIYEHIVFAPHGFCSPAGIETSLAGRTLTVNGVSKAYAMTGWRIGYAAGPSDLIRAMITLQGQSTTNACSISQWASFAALTGPQDYLESARAAFHRRRDHIVARLNACPGIVCPMPEGAFYVYPSIAGLIGTSTPDGRHIRTDADFAEALLEAEGVAVVFGAAFGLSPHFRVSYAAADSVLESACDRIQQFCSTLT